MALLIPNLRQIVKFSGSADPKSQRAIRALEDWADGLIRQLSQLEVSEGWDITLPIAQSDVTDLVADLAAKVASTRTISTTAPLTGGGDLSANRTFAVSTFASGTSGIVPASGGGTVNYLRADVGWSPAINYAIAGMFGDGFWGAATMDGSTAVTGCSRSGSTYTAVQDLFYTDLTIDNAVILRLAGWRLFVNGTLTNNGLIQNSGAAGTNGVAGASTGGVGGSGGFFLVSTSGGNGGVAGGATTAGIVRNTITSTSDLKGPIGGDGLDGPVAHRGAGGGGGALVGTSGGNLTVTSAANGGPTLMALYQGSHEKAPAFWCAATGGGGGGSGSGGAGGAGGGGGGFVFIAARVIAGAGAVESKGGNGGNGQTGSADRGGGGGGGGGCMVLLYNTRSGNSYSVAGGTGGAKSGVSSGDGGDGATGNIHAFNFSGDGT